MKLRMMLFAMVLPSLAVAQSANAQQWSSDKDKMVAIKALELVNSPAKPPSVAIGVSINGTPVVAKGFGVADKATGQKSSAQTLYQVGSLSKQLTAAAILGWIEDQNRIRISPTAIVKAPVSLDTTIDKIIPDASGWMPKGAVKLRHLLNMQSGFYNYTKLDPNGTGMPNTKASITPGEMQAFIRLMMDVRPQQFAPGGQYEYSNTNYYLLATALEALLPQPAMGRATSYRAYVKSRVFDRAGMTSTGWVNAPVASLPIAKAPYDTTNSDWNKPSWPKGAGEVSSNVDDFLKWHAALMNKKIISPASLQSMFKPVALMGNSPPTFYGMGWAVNTAGDFDWYSHGGSIAGFSSFDGIFLNRKTGQWTSVVLLTNADNVKLDKVSACLAQAAMDNAQGLLQMNPITIATCQGI